jgi:hypothetical protein
VYEGVNGFQEQDVDGDPMHPLNCSSYRRLLKVICVLMYWRKRAQATALGETAPKEHYSEHLKEAEVKAYLWAQRESMQRTIFELKDGAVQPDNPHRVLNPAFGSDGVVRVTSRLKNAKHLRLEVRCPPIIPHDHPLARLLIRDVHARALKHVGGLSHVLATLNRRVWITNARRLIKTLLHGCVKCKKLYARISPQKMAPLPDCRIQDGSERLEAFTTVGVDYAGPFLTKQPGRLPHAKRYLILYTCAQYRCVHLEIAYDMTAEGFLNSFTRFVSRRRRPSRVYSDNGKYFEAANKALIRLLTDPEMDETLRQLHPDIEWRFNIPYASNTGGMFERLIKSAKLALYKIVDPGLLRDDELNTAFCAAEAYINSRPLTYTTTDSGDLEALTPGHFLRGESFRDLAPVPPELDYVSRWHAMQTYLDGFWKRFVEEYLPSLQKQRRWNVIKDEPEVGDVVVVLEGDDKKRWPLGRITTVYPSQNDGIIRSVEVNIGGKLYKRASQRVIPLLRDERYVSPRRQ